MLGSILAAQTESLGETFWGWPPSPTLPPQAVGPVNSLRRGEQRPRGDKRNDRIKASLKNYIKASKAGSVLCCLFGSRNDRSWENIIEHIIEDLSWENPPRSLPHKSPKRIDLLTCPGRKGVLWATELPSVGNDLVPLVSNRDYGERQWAGVLLYFLEGWFEQHLASLISELHLGGMMFKG